MTTKKVWQHFNTICTSLNNRDKVHNGFVYESAILRRLIFLEDLYMDIDTLSLQRNTEAICMPKTITLVNIRGHECWTHGTHDCNCRKLRSTPWPLTWGIGIFERFTHRAYRPSVDSIHNTRTVLDVRYQVPWQVQNRNPNGLVLRRNFLRHFWQADPLRRFLQANTLRCFCS